MAGIITTDGKHLMGEMVFNLNTTDRDATMKLGLHCLGTVSAATTLAAAAASVPTGTGYAAQTLADADWTVTAGVPTHTLKTFTAGAGGWTGSVYGYYIYTVAAGGTPRLLFIEVDSQGPYSFAANDSYQVTPRVTIA